MPVERRRDRVEPVPYPLHRVEVGAVGGLGVGVLRPFAGVRRDEDEAARVARTFRGRTRIQEWRADGGGVREAERPAPGEVPAPPDEVTADPVLVPVQGEVAVDAGMVADPAVLDDARDAVRQAHAGMAPEDSGVPVVEVLRVLRAEHGLDERVRRHGHLCVTARRGPMRAACPARPPSRPFFPAPRKGAWAKGPRPGGSSARSVP